MSLSIYQILLFFLHPGAGEHPRYLIGLNASNTIPIINYTSLKCIVATSIIKNRIQYKNQIPKTLEEFVEMHEP